MQNPTMKIDKELRAMIEDIRNKYPSPNTSQERVISGVESFINKIDSFMDNNKSLEDLMSSSEGHDFFGEKKP